MTEYPVVSVMTPVHNATEEEFTRAYKSVKTQTYDFAKIEWIVAVHDMDEEYIKKLRNIAPEDNVHIIPVNERGWSVSVPRNVALDNVSGKYLFFLDSDDELTSDCIKEIVSIMEETGADAIEFRPKFVLDNPAENGNLKTELSFLRAFYEKINKSLEELRGVKRIFSMADDIRVVANKAGGCKSLVMICYNANFLKKIGVHFDETLHAGEDYLFTVETGKYINNFCILTDFYGYIYHFRRTSMTHTIVRSKKHFLEWPKILEASKQSEEKQNWNLNTVKWLFFIARKVDLVAYVNDDIPKETVNYLREYIFNLRAFIYESHLIMAVSSIRHELDIICNILNEKQKKIIRSSYLYRIIHKDVLLRVVPIKDDFQKYLRNTVKDVPELRVIQLENETNPFLAVISESLYPELRITDLTQIDKTRQNSIIESYNKSEKLRGFNPCKEIPLRITLFQISSSESVLSVTWNDFFISHFTIERLIQDIKKNFEEI